MSEQIHTFISTQAKHGAAGQFQLLQLRFPTDNSKAGYDSFLNLDGLNSLSIQVCTYVRMHMYICVTGCAHYLF
jgi:hypothetical protein